MYIHSVQIHQIRSIADLIWLVDSDSHAGWHVIIGDNGSGKSTLLRAIALALVGPSEAVALRQEWNNWLRFGAKHGFIRIQLDSDKTLDRASHRGRPLENYYVAACIDFNRQPNGNVTLGKMKLKSDHDPDKYVWGKGTGWFSASYGPFRRFAGGDKDYERLFYSNPKLARHLSVFGESIALTECLRWLQELKFKQLEGHREGHLLEAIKAFVNQAGFLPHHAQLQEVSSIGVTFIDGNGCQVPVEDLSDGYRSILSMTFELIRQLARTYGPDRIFDPNDPTRIIVPGVVLVDEVDVHLHPTWQRRVGFWFREHFPNLQFIVTTHSPLICQAAVVGSVFRLAKPGSNEPSGMLQGTELKRLLYGNVLDAYSTEVFGDTSRSDEAKYRMTRHAELNTKEINEQLSESERKEQADLRASTPTAAHTVEEAVAG